jgi:hypothetical protein
VAAPETYSDVAMRRLDRQAALIDALDTKARATLGAASAVVPIFGALLAALVKDAPKASIVLYGLAFVCYLVMVGFVTKATRVSAWSLRPELATLTEYADTHDEASVKFWVASECAESFSTNAPGVQRKAAYVDRSIAALVIVTLLLSVAALVLLAT